MPADPAPLRALAGKHYDDPCIHCGIPHDDVPAGACNGNATKAIPIAYRKVETRWDGYDLHRVRYSDGSIREHWSHVSMHAPYRHWGRFDELTQPPRWDAAL